MTSTKLNLTCKFDKELCLESGNSVRYLVASLKAKQKNRKKERGPLNIALVIDASGSMDGGKLEAAKSAAQGLTERLHPSDRLTLVSFSSDIQVHLDAVKIGDVSKQRIQAEIRNLRTRGLTNLSGGWFKGTDCAARVAERDKTLTPRIIILSDGHANEGICNPVELQEHARELRNRGVMTSTLGIGNGYDEILLKGLAEEGGGRFHDAEEAEDISSVLLGELGDIIETIVEDAQMELKIPKGLKVEVLGVKSTKVSSKRIKVPVGNILTGLERNVVFKVTCPKIPAGDRLTFKFLARGKIPGNATDIKAKTGSADLVSADNRENLQQVRNNSVAEIVANHWNAFILSTADMLNREGQYDKAKDFVEAELHYFKRYVKGLALERDLVSNLKLLARRVKRSFSPRLHKEVMMNCVTICENRFDHVKERPSLSKRMKAEMRA